MLLLIPSPDHLRRRLVENRIVHASPAAQGDGIRGGPGQRWGRGGGLKAGGGQPRRRGGFALRGRPDGAGRKRRRIGHWCCVLRPCSAAVVGPRFRLQGGERSVSCFGSRRRASSYQDTSDISWPRDKRAGTGTCRLRGAQDANRLPL